MKTLISIALFLTLTTAAHADIKTEEVAYSAGGAKLKGYLATDPAVKGKRPGILVVHEWWGHNKHARDRAEMLAKLGYTALALDMYGDGKLADHPDKAGAFMNAAFKDWAGSEAKFNAAKKLLSEHPTVDPARIGAIGFCFGGAVSLKMARGGADLKGVVAFHSALPDAPPAEKDKVKAAVMVINGSDDPFLKPEVVAKFMQDMVAANADLSYVSLAGVRHSFTNPQADEFRKKFGIDALKYDKQADERSWKTMQAFFKRVFGN